MNIRRVLKFALLSLFISQQHYSQESEVFITYTGGFEVSLPRGVSGFNGIGSGLRLTWRQPEVEYEIGFHERQGLPLAQLKGEFSYEEAVRRYFNKFSATGELLYKKNSTLQNNLGQEYKYRTRDSIFLLRLFLVEDRVYQLQAQIPIGKESHEQQVLRVFDSVKLVSKEAVAKHFTKQIADATPPALPQKPKAPKAKTDLQDRNLKGPVKAVITEFANYALNDSLKQKHPTLYEEFDSDGNLIKAIDYDSHGSPMKVTVYGYVAGKRVARISSIEREDAIPGLVVEFPKESKFDTRFEEFYTYIYVNNRLAEERNFWSNGALFGRATYQYAKNTKITQYFDGGRKAFRRIVAKLDENGNEIKLTIFEPDGGKYIEQAPLDITYDSFDKQGNWTQRTTSRWYGMDGRGKTFREHVDYRTIEYYP